MGLVAGRFSYISAERIHELNFSSEENTQKGPRTNVRMRQRDAQEI